jgi:hypothetical protein
MLPIIYLISKAPKMAVMAMAVLGAVGAATATAFVVSGFSFIEKTEGFSGTLVHVNYISRDSSANPIDPMDGEDILADTWVLVNGDGLPTHVKARYTTRTGELVQLVIATPQKSFVYMPRSEHTGTCETAAFPPGPQGSGLIRFLPIQASEDALLAEGFISGGAHPVFSDVRLPDDPTGRIPLRSDPLAEWTGRTLVKEVTKPGGKETVVLSIDPRTGYLLGSRSSFTAPHEEILHERSEQYLRIEVFQSTLDDYQDFGLEWREAVCPS